MTNFITLDNWREKLQETFDGCGITPTSDLGIDVPDMIDLLLDLQKQALKDEAVKRIEEEKAQHDHSPEMELARLVPLGGGTLKTYDQALSHAQDIIRNLEL